MKSKIALLTLGIVISSLGVSHANNVDFKDIKGHWAEKEIVTFSEKGYIDGYENSTFIPNGEITRAEFVKIFNNVFGLTQNGNNVFDDTKTHWAKNEIDIAVTNGVCSGKSFNLFAPDDKITRQEASKMLSNYLNLSDKNVDKLTTYKDYKEVSSWAVTDVEGVIEKGYMNGYPDGKFNPLGTITRAETVSMLIRVISDGIPPVKPIKPMPFEEFAAKLQGMGFDNLGSFWENGKHMGTVRADGGGAYFALIQNSGGFDSTIKNCFNMLLPTKGNELYKIVSNPFKDQTLSMDGRKVVIKLFSQGVSVNITN